VTPSLTTAEAAQRWADVWSRAWPAADIAAVTALYAPNARYISDPFRASVAPHEYVSWVFEAQRTAECRFGAPIVAGDRAAVDWWGVIEGNDGLVETVAGTSLLRFSPDGLVVEQRDAWAAALGRTASPHWAR
jgi:hypothetical protein